VRQTTAQPSIAVFYPYEQKGKKKKMAQWGVSAFVLQTGFKVNTQPDLFLITIFWPTNPAQNSCDRQ